MKQAIPFISFKDDQFLINPEAENFLNSLEDTNLSVISVVGKYRCGKSYFINRVLLNLQKEGFQVGNTVNSCTKGIWIWPQIVKNPENPDQNLLVMDTEGFAGIEQNLNHDGKINLLALLLSQLMIYNAQGQLDEPTLNHLYLMINLASMLKTYNKNHSPDLLCIVRDFSLQLVNKQGQNIKENQYLDYALQESKGTQDISNYKNKIRQKIKGFFNNLYCSTMVRPVECEKLLSNMNKIDRSIIRPEFENDIKKVRTLIQKIQKNQRHQYTCGSSIVILAQSYCDALNNGELPNIENSWTYMIKNEYLRAVKWCVQNAEQILNNIENLEIAIKKIQNDNDKCFGSLPEWDDSQKYYQQMQEQVNEKINEKKKKRNNMTKEDIIRQIENGQKKSFKQLLNLMYGWDQEIKDSILEKYFNVLDNELNEAYEKSNYFENKYKNQLQNQEDLQALDLKDQLIKKVQQYQDLQKQQNVQQLQFNDLKLQTSNQETQIQELQQIIQKQNQQLQTTQQQYQQLKKSNFKLMHELNLIKQNNNNYQKDSQEQNLNFKQQLDFQIQENQQKQQKINLLLVQNEQLKKQYDFDCGDHNTAKTHQNNYLNMNQKLTENQEIISKMKKQINEIEEEKKELKEFIEKELQQKEIELKEREDKIQLQEEEMQQYRLKQMNYEQLLSQLQIKNQTLDQSVYDRIQKTLEFQKQYQNLQALNQSLKQKLEEKDVNNYELIMIQNDFEKKMLELKNEREKYQIQSKLTEEKQNEKKELENQVKQLQIQTQESKELNEAIINSIDAPIICNRCNKAYTPALFNKHLPLCSAQIHNSIYLDQNQSRSLLRTRDSQFQTQRNLTHRTNSSNLQSNFKMANTRFEKNYTSRDFRI